MINTQETQTPDQSTGVQQTDIFNKRIEAGDTIVYATRRGSSTFLNKLQVTEVTPTAIKGWSPDDLHRRTRSLSNFGTVAKVC